MNIGRRKNAKGDKYLYHYDCGRGKDQHSSTGLFLYVKLKNPAEKQYNFETKAILHIKKGRAILDQQAVGTDFIPQRNKELYDTGGEITLQEISRSKPILKNRAAAEVEAAVVRMAFDYPAYGQQRASNELRKQDIFVSAGGVRSVWQRNDLEVFDKRLKSLETKVAQDGIVLSEAQMIALEQKKEKREAFGEIETEHPGYLGAQDTYYVGNIKGVDRIYQQPFIDTYFDYGKFEDLRKLQLALEVVCSYFRTRILADMLHLIEPFVLLPRRSAINS